MSKFTEEMTNLTAVPPSRSKSRGEIHAHPIFVGFCLSVCLSVKEAVICVRTDICLECRILVFIPNLDLFFFADSAMQNHIECVRIKGKILVFSV